MQIHETAGHLGKLDADSMGGKNGEQTTAAEETTVIATTTTTRKHHAQPPQLKHPRAPAIFLSEEGGDLE